MTASPNASDEVADIAQAIDSLLMHGVEGIVAIAPQDRARDAIHRIGARVPVLTLQGALGIEQEESVIESLVMVLGDLGTMETIEGILQACDAGHISYELACQALLAAGPGAAEMLREILQRPDEHDLVREAAAQTLRLLGAA